MLKSLALVLLGHSLGVSAVRDAGGLQEYPSTGDLSKFPVITWRFNGGLQPWRSHSDLEFVPSIQDEAAITNLKEAMVSWVANPEIIIYFLSKLSAWEGSMSVTKGAELQKQITSDIRESGLGMFKLGTPSMMVRHGTPVRDSQGWVHLIQRDMITACNGECQNDFLVIDYEGDSAEVMANYIELTIRGRTFNSIILPSGSRVSCVDKDGGYCTPDVALKFMTQSIQWFSLADYVERWAWDGADPSIASLGDPSGLLNEGGSLNAQGKAFNEVEFAWLGPAE